MSKLIKDYLKGEKRDNLLRKMTIGLRHQLFNRGVIFNQLPNTILFHSKLFKTESSFLRSIVNNSNYPLKIKSDNHSLRMIRVTTSPLDKYYKKLFGEDVLKFINEHADKIDISEIGGWTFIESAITGLRYSETDIPQSENDFLDFLLAHCKVEKEFIGKTKEIDELDDYFDMLNPFVNQWLMLSPKYDVQQVSDDLINKNLTENLINFIIAPLLYWSALYESYLSVYFKEIDDSDYQNKMTRYLPIIDKKGEISYSNVVLLNYKKAIWEGNTEGKHNWEEFYRDIVRAQENENIDKKKQVCTQYIDPDTSKIKQNFKRIRNGKKQMTVHFFLHHLLLLESDIYESYKKQQIHTNYKNYLSSLKPDPSALQIVFIQLFDTIQRGLIKEGVSKELIVKQFARYPDYLDLVERRFEYFKNSGKIEPMI